jgi:hypothetical protein
MAPECSSLVRSGRGAELFIAQCNSTTCGHSDNREGGAADEGNPGEPPSHHPFAYQPKAVDPTVDFTLRVTGDTLDMSAPINFDLRAEPLVADLRLTDFAFPREVAPLAQRAAIIRSAFPPPPV